MSFRSDFRFPDSGCAMDAYARFRAGSMEASGCKKFSLASAWEHEYGQPPVSAHEAATDCHLTLDILRRVADSASAGTTVHIHREVELLSNCQPDALAGLRFVITGVLDRCQRGTAERFIRRYGGVVTGAVSGATDFLIAGENPGAYKLGKADSFEVKVFGLGAVFGYG